jgi:hypothetical protein
MEVRDQGLSVHSMHIFPDLRIQHMRLLSLRVRIRCPRHSASVKVPLRLANMKSVQDNVLVRLKVQTEGLGPALLIGLLSSWRLCKTKIFGLVSMFRFRVALLSSASKMGIDQVDNCH